MTKITAKSAKCKIDIGKWNSSYTDIANGSLAESVQDFLGHKANRLSVYLCIAWLFFFIITLFSWPLLSPSHFHYQQFMFMFVCYWSDCSTNSGSSSRSSTVDVNGLLFVCLHLVLLYVVLLSLNIRRRIKYRHIPGPTPWPLVGNFFEIQASGGTHYYQYDIIQKYAHRHCQSTSSMSSASPPKNIRPEAGQTQSHCNFDPKYQQQHSAASLTPSQLVCHYETLGNGGVNDSDNEIIGGPPSHRHRHCHSDSSSTSDSGVGIGSGTVNVSSPVCVCCPLVVYWRFLTPVLVVVDLNFAHSIMNRRFDEFPNRMDEHKKKHFLLPKGLSPPLLLGNGIRWKQIKLSFLQVFQKLQIKLANRIPTRRDRTAEECITEMKIFNTITHTDAPAATVTASASSTLLDCVSLFEWQHCCTLRDSIMNMWGRDIFDISRESAHSICRATQFLPKQSQPFSRAFLMAKDVGWWAILAVWIYFLPKLPALANAVNQLNEFRQHMQDESRCQTQSAAKADAQTQQSNGIPIPILSPLTQDKEKEMKPPASANEINKQPTEQYHTRSGSGTSISPPAWNADDRNGSRQTVPVSMLWKSAIEESATKYRQSSAHTSGLATLPENFDRAQSYEFLFGSVDTIALGLTGAIYHLAQDTTKQHKLRTELLEACQQLGIRMTQGTTVLDEESALPSNSMTLASAIVEDSFSSDSATRGQVCTQSRDSMFPYLSSVIWESLRLYPPGALFRVSSKSILLPCGSTIDTGMEYQIPMWALHHSEQLWEQPFAFQPERFLTAETNANINSTASAKDWNFFGKVVSESLVKSCRWLPFGSGPRKCLGEHYAVLSLKVKLAEIIKNFQIELVGNNETNNESQQTPADLEESISEGNAVRLVKRGGLFVMQENLSWSPKENLKVRLTPIIDNASAITNASV